MDGNSEPRVVRDYTRGYKLRKFVGKLGTWRPPWGIATIPQYVVAASTFFAMLWLWRALDLWSRLGGGLVAAIATVVGILGSTVAAFMLADRRTMIDGRPPTSAALAVLAFLLLRVRYAGRLTARPARLTGCVWLSSGGDPR
jgi:hypothetical protein